MTVGEVAAQSVRGSEIGIRRCLGRLVEQGIVRATQMGRNRVHELNRDHVAAHIADSLAGLRLELWKRMRGELRRWRVEPYRAAVFGSAARAEGDSESDIDLLLVHPLLPGDPPVPRQATVLRKAVVAFAGPPAWGKAEASLWTRQVDRLRERVVSWTGNPLQVVDVSYAEWIGRPVNEGIWADIEERSVDLLATALSGKRSRAES